MRNSVVLLLLVMCLTVVSGSAGSEDFQSQVDFARKAIQDGFLDLAESKLNMVIGTEAPRRIQAEAHLLLGRVFYEKSLSQRALQEFDFVVAQFGDTDLVDMSAYWVAEVYFKEGS